MATGQAWRPPPYTRNLRDCQRRLRRANAHIGAAVDGGLPQ